MVKQQLRKRGIKDANVLAAMEQVKRHNFVPRHLIMLAYQDRPLPIEHKQTISQPYIVALMTELIKPRAEDIILEIGTGSGYQAAVLALLCREVYTIEIIPELAESAGKRLHSLGYNNVFVKTGDGFLGWPKYAPFDKSIITASAPKVPQPLIEQLKEGGLLIMPLAERYPQQLCLYVKENNTLVKHYITDVLFVPMTGKIRE